MFVWTTQKNPHGRDVVIILGHTKILLTIQTMDNVFSTPFGKRRNGAGAIMKKKHDYF